MRFRSLVFTTITRSIENPRRLWRTKFISSTFFKSILTNSRAPVELRSHIDLPAADDDLVNQTDQTQEVYSLRRGRTIIKNKIPETKYDTLTFKHFFPKLLKSCKHLDFAVS